MGKSKADLLKEAEALKMVIDDLKKTIDDQRDLLNNSDRDKRYFQTLMEAIPAGVFIADKNGKLLIVNDYARKIWGRSIPASTDSWLAYSDWKGYDHETGKRLAPEEWATTRALTKGEITFGDIVDIERFDGSRGTIINSASPVKDENGNITGAITINIDITKQKQAEASLRESREKYQALTETNIDFIWEIDCEGRYTYCSPQCEKLWNLKPSDLLGQTPVYTARPEDKARRNEMLKKIMEHPAPFHKLKEEAMGGDGNPIYVEVSGVPFYGNDGQLCGYRGVTKDTTERVLTERALKESNHLAQQHINELENIHKTSSVGLAVMDTNGRYLRVNDALAEINGLPAEDHIGKTIGEILPDFVNQVSDYVSSIISSGKPQFGSEYSLNIPGKPGMKRYFSTDWLPLRDESGKITAFNIAIVETTGQKRAQEEVEKKNKLLLDSKRALERSQKKLNLALENGKIGMWELDLVTNEFKADYRMMQMFDSKTQNVTIDDLERFIHEDDLQYVKNALKNTIQWENEEEAIFRTNPQSGPIRHISSRAIVTRDKKGKPVKIIGVCFDISSFARESEKGLMKLNEELQRSNRDLEQFAHIASHDLQEPLRMISSFNQLLQLKYADKLDADANEYIKYAVDGSKRMYELLNGLLAYSRVNNKESVLEQVDMNNILDVVLENLRLSIEEKTAQIHSVHLPTITADKNQMIQLFQNLIGNALKFVKGKPDIFITYADIDKFHSFSVRDNGIGFEEQYYDKIFRIFQRLNILEYKGTGIGLSLSKRIVERHGGKIRVESKPGEGSVFTFTILKDLPTFK